MRLPIAIWGVLIALAFNAGTAVCGTDLPHEFDSLVPAYDSARPVDTRYTRERVTVRFTTPDGFDRVAAFYEQTLKSAGWKVSLSDAGKKLIAVGERVHLTLTEAADSQGFVIDLYYPGGRE